MNIRELVPGQLLAMLTGPVVHVLKAAGIIITTVATSA
jgi:hypothetical protein